MIVRCVFVFTIVVFCQAIVPGPKYPPTKGEIWPKPQYEKKGKTIHLVDTDKLEFKVTKKSCKILTDAIDRAKKTLHKLSRIAKRYHDRQSQHLDLALDTVNVVMTQPCETYPYHGMDESYNLTVSTTASLTSASVWGILHGIESFLHLVYQSDDHETLLIQDTNIHDYPRHPHRGLLLDTSRHYLSVSKLLTTLDAMAMNKMNVFHWHIVDDHSFPYQSEQFPELSEKGAYHKSMVYTKANIQKIVEYARNRGIRVIPEIDVPGHVRSWGEAYPQILTKCYTGNKVTSLGPLDPTNEHTYKLLGQLLQEVGEWFPDEYLHLGGDEVDSKCWVSNPSLLHYMLKHNMSSWTKLHSLFMGRATPLVGDRKIIVWEEVFDEKVPLSNDTVVQIWLNAWESKINEVLGAGKLALFSSEWYLSVLEGGGDWEKFYNVDPRQRIADRPLVHRMVGGEACMWGEYVDDTNFLQRVWPRACGVAERLWSEASRDAERTGERARHAPEYEREADIMNHGLQYGDRENVSHVPEYGDRENVSHVLEYGDRENVSHVLEYGDRENVSHVLEYGDRENVSHVLEYGDRENVSLVLEYGDRENVSHVLEYEGRENVSHVLEYEGQENMSDERETMDHVRSRIEEQACRMRRRGVPAQPPNGPGFCVL